MNERIHRLKGKCVYQGPFTHSPNNGDYFCPECDTRKGWGLDKWNPAHEPIPDYLSSDTEILNMLIELINAGYTIDPRYIGGKIVPGEAFIISGSKTTETWCQGPTREAIAEAWCEFMEEKDV